MISVNHFNSCPINNVQRAVHYFYFLVRFFNKAYFYHLFLMFIVCFFQLLFVDFFCF